MINQERTWQPAIPDVKMMWSGIITEDPGQGRRWGPGAWGQAGWLR
jgi:hypothetical protein